MEMATAIAMIMDCYMLCNSSEHQVLFVAVCRNVLGKN